MACHVTVTKDTTGQSVSQTGYNNNNNIMLAGRCKKYHAYVKIIKIKLKQTTNLKHAHFMPTIIYIRIGNSNVYARDAIGINIYLCKNIYSNNEWEIVAHDFPL